MRKGVYYFSTVLLLSVILSSCEKKDEDSKIPKKNEYVYNGVNKEIAWIGISPEFITSDSRYVINILPKKPVEGEGLFAPEEYIYVETPFSFDGQEIDLTSQSQSFSWDFEYKTPEFDLEGYRNDKTVEGDISSGTILIKQLNASYSYEINFNIKFTDGKTVKGYYSGNLKHGDIDTEFYTWQ